MEIIKKRKMQNIIDDDHDHDNEDDNSGGVMSDKVYKFQVLLPNGISVMVVKRNPLGDMPVERFLEKVREKCNVVLRETKGLKNRRKIEWSSKELFLEDGLGNKIKFKLCFNEFKPYKIHYLRVFDGIDQTVDTFENMWDLTPDTDLLTELPEDYTFETALADLIDNSLQAVWSNAKNERKLISIDVHDDKVSVFDTGPGMDGTEENSIVKWGKMGASVHRSSKKLAIGGLPPFLTPFFGMFGYGGTIASMHLGRHAVVSAKTKESMKVYWLHLERDALLKRSGSGSDLNWKAAGGIRDPSDEEIEKSPHKSFTKVDMKPKLKIPDIFQLQCKLKDIYFPYIQCDELSKAGRTTTLVEFQVNGVNLAEIDGGEVAISNLHSCHGPDFVLNLHLSFDEDKIATKCSSMKTCREANARMKCVYLPIVEAKESIDVILEKLKSDGFAMKEDFETFNRVSIRRLGRLLPDARWDLLPFMKPKMKRGNKLQILKRCCLRVKCFIETDAGFNPIPAKTDLAPQHPFTKALKDLGGDSLRKEKEVEVEVFKSGKKLTLLQLEKEYQDWILEMHGQYDEEMNCGDDEPVLVVNALNKEALGIKSDVVRVHQAISRKGKSWRSGQRVKILKGACPGCHKNNTYATLEYFLLEGFQGDLGGEARVICRPLGILDQDGCELKVEATSTHLELHSSLSLPIVVIDSGKCIPVGVDDWDSQMEKLTLKMPSTVEVLGPKQCKKLGIVGALPTEAPVCAGLQPPKEVVAVLRPSNFSSNVPNDLDKKFIIRDNYEMCMVIKFKAKGAKICKFDDICSKSATSTSRNGVHGLYFFDLSSVSSLFQKAGVYSFLFSVATCRGCEVSVQVKASSTIKRWELLKDDRHQKFSVSAGSCFPSFSVARFDVYNNCVPFESIPDITAQLISNGVVLCHLKKVIMEMSSDNYHLVVRNVLITTNNLDKVCPSYGATLILSSSDKVPIIRIPCQVFPGPLHRVSFHPLDFGNGLLPQQVILDAKLEMFDRHENHVKQGTKAQLCVHGLCLLDDFGVMREADNLGCIDLSGILKVVGPYGKPVSLSVKFDKHVIFTKKFHVQKRELTMTTKVPEFCLAGSTLKNVAFEVVNPEGLVDETIHDDDKRGQSHTVMIRTDLPGFDNSMRYTFIHGRCVIPSIPLPQREGGFYIEAVHCHHNELHLKFKVNVSPSQAMYTECDTNSDLQVSGEVHDEGTSQSSEENIIPLPASIAVDNVVAVPQSLKKEYAVTSPVQVPLKMQGDMMFRPSDGKFKLHSDSFALKIAAASLTGKQVQDKLGTRSEKPPKQCNPKDEFNSYIFQSPEGKIASLDSSTPWHLITSMESDLWGFEDVEKEISKCGLDIKVYEDDLRDLQVIRDAAMLELQAMEPLPLNQSDYRFQKEEMLGKIENKIGSAAAVYSVSSKNMSLQEDQLKMMCNIVGIVACLGTVPSHILSCLLAEYLGEDQMLAIVCQSSITTMENYEHALNVLAAELGNHISGRFLLICLEDIRVFDGGVNTSEPQKRLALSDPKLPDGTTPPGFLGYAVNMIQIDVDHLEIKTKAGYGLRETLFYKLFGELQVYDIKKNMKQARGCMKDGAVSLDGGIIRGNGVISLGCRQVDVHFPVVAVDHQLNDSVREEINVAIKRKNVAEEAIAATCKFRSTTVEQFQEKCDGYLKLVEEKIASQKLRLSQESLKTSPLPSQTSGH